MFEIKNNEKIICRHLEGLSASEIPVKISCCKCRDCVKNMEQKAYRVSAKRDLYARSPNVSRLKMTEKVLSFLRLRGASGAQGISAPASCRKAHKRRFILNPWILRFAKTQLRMTIPALALIFTLITTGESRADEETPVCKEGHGYTVTCIEKLSDANGNNSCGDNCSYRVINENGQQVLHIYKTDISKSASIRDGAFSPYYYADNQVKDAQNKVIPLQNIVLDNDFENIGNYAFANSGAQILNANGKFVFNNIGSYSTYGNNRVTLNGDVYLNNPLVTSLERANIKGDVIISENMQTMPGWVLGSSNIDGNIIIPDSVDSIKYFAVNVSNITGKIYCASGAKACYDMAKKGCEESSNNEACFQSLNSLSKKFSVYPDGCEKLEANLKCTKCKSASFKLEDDGWCLRKIYTPAEAAEVLKDDNTNEVTITFKK